MTATKLETTLRLMVRRYGFDQVDACLREIGLSAGEQENTNPKETSGKDGIATKPSKSRARVTASGYVSKLDIPLEKRPAMVEIAERFQDKSFLPTFGDIANFCQIYGLETPASKTRASAIPRVFKFIAAMDTAKIQSMLDEKMFSGPSRLGPIADAIRNNGRAAAASGLQRR